MFCISILSRQLWFTAFVFVMMLKSSSAFAGGGHDHSHGEEFASAPASRTLELSDTAIRNLGLETAAVIKAPLRITVSIFVQVVADPRHRYSVTAPSAVRLSEISALAGQRVTKDQLLARGRPLRAGSSELDLRSPISGILSSAPDGIGEVFEEGSEVFRVLQDGHLLLRGDILQGQDIRSVKTGTRSTATFLAFPEREFAGTVERVDAALNEEIPLLHCYIKLDDKDLPLMLNMRGRAEIVVEERQDVLQIPARALLGELGNYFVYRRVGNTFRKLPVEIGHRNSSWVEVKKGVREGGRIVTQGNYQLQYAKSSDSPTQSSNRSHGHSH